MLGHCQCQSSSSATHPSLALDISGDSQISQKVTSLRNQWSAASFVARFEVRLDARIHGDHKSGIRIASIDLDL
eukprot:5215249-Amphidinium_carterae.1